MANSNLTVANLDFESIKSSLQTYMTGQTIFKDFDFKGSNLNVLLDVLAYNTYMNNFYLNMVASESFLDSAQLRDSVVSHAKILNYLPGSKTASKAQVRLTVYPDDQPANIVIPKYTRFTSMVGSNTFSFSTDEGITIFADKDGSYITPVMDLYEGEIVTELFAINTANTNQRYIIGNADVDTSSIVVRVTKSTTDFANSLWTKSAGISGMTGTSNNFFLEPCENSRYELQFGDGVLGRPLDNGNVVEVKYRRASGESSDGASVFALSGSIQGYSNVVVSSGASAVGGGEAESISSIKFNAPKSISIQDRLITIQDYKTLLKQEFNDIEAINVYGGDETSPPKFGKVIISVDLKNSDGISASRKAEIESFVNQRSSLSIRPEVIDPEFLYVDLVSQVVYNPNVTTLGQQEIRSKVVAGINTFMAASINDFDSKLRQSKLVREIDSADPSILHNETRLELSKTIVPVLGATATYSLKFDNEIYREIPKNGEFVDGSSPLSSTTFTYDGLSGCSIRDNGDGVLQIVRLDASINSVVNAKIGSIDYVTGTVDILSLSVTSYVGAGIKITANPSKQTVKSSANIILKYNNTPVITVNQERI